MAEREEYDGECFIILSGKGLRGREIPRDAYLEMVRRSASPSADVVAKINAKLKEKSIHGSIPTDKPASAPVPVDNRSLSEIMRDAAAAREARGLSRQFDPRNPPKTRGISSPDERHSTD